MAYDKIAVQLPKQDVTQSIEVAAFVKHTVVQAHGVEIQHALANKNDSLVIVIEPTTTAEIKIKAGDNYPNAILGDLSMTPTNEQVNTIILEDISRFENRDGSVRFDFGLGFVGTMYAVAKRAGIKPVV